MAVTPDGYNFRSLENVVAFLRQEAERQGKSLDYFIELYHKMADHEDDYKGEYPALVYAALLLGYRLEWHIH